MKFFSCKHPDKKQNHIHTLVFKARALSDPLARNSFTKGSSCGRMLGTPSPRETHSFTAERTARQAGAEPWCLSAVSFFVLVDREKRVKAGRAVDNIDEERR